MIENNSAMEKMERHLLTEKFFLENHTEVNIPEELKSLFRLPLTYIKQNLYKDRNYGYNLENFLIKYFKSNDGDYDYHVFYKRRFYIDCSHFFLLFYEDFPVAIIGFEIRDMKILIRQIQGINESIEGKGKNRNFHISFFYWQKVLIKYVEIYFGFIGFKEIRVLKAKKNKWIEKGEKVNKKLLRQVKINYDEVAINMKYKGKFNPIRTSFYKRL